MKLRLSQVEYGLQKLKVQPEDGKLQQLVHYRERVISISVRKGSKLAGMFYIIEFKYENTKHQANSQYDHILKHLLQLYSNSVCLCYHCELYYLRVIMKTSSIKLCISPYLLLSLPLHSQQLSTTNSSLTELDKTDCQMDGCARPAVEIQRMLQRMPRQQGQFIAIVRTLLPSQVHSCLHTPQNIVHFVPISQYQPHKGILLALPAVLLSYYTHGPCERTGDWSCVLS